MRNLLFGFAFAAAVASTGSAWPQAWPAKPIRAIVPSTAGSRVPASNRCSGLPPVRHSSTSGLPSGANATPPKNAVAVP